MRKTWLIFGVLCVAVIAWRFEPVVDLAWFLPDAVTEQEQVLVERLGQGPGSQLVFISLRVASGSNAQAVSDAFREQLDRSGLFRRVVNGSVEFDQSMLPDVVWQHRYLLADLDLSESSLADMFAERLADVAVMSQPWIMEMLAADPALAALQVMENIGPVHGNDFEWVAPDGLGAVLLAEARAPAFELAAQEEMVNFVRTVSVEGVATINVHGMGVYGVDLQTTIKNEVSVRSIAATVVAAAIFLLAYRRFYLLCLGLLPLVLGGLAGLAAIALLFPKVHGITLAFGFTLLGVAIDYPLHFLSHYRNNSANHGVSTIWRTMSVGMISTVLAFGAIALGGSVGLAQMGIFSAVGIAVAFLATRTLLPAMTGLTTEKVAVPPEQVLLLPKLRQLLWLSALVVSTVLALTVMKPHWSNDLSSVSPVPAERLLEDMRLRERFGAPDIRTLLAVRNTDPQRVLEATESLTSVLDLYVAKGMLSGYQTVSSLLPSHKTQRQRMAAIENTPDLAATINANAVKAGFRDGGFSPFSEALQKTVDSGALLNADAYADTQLSSLIDGAFYRDSGEWVSLVTLYGVTDVAELSAKLSSDSGEAVLVDLKDASESLMQRYRYTVLRMLLAAVIVIAIYLLFALGPGRQTIWILGTVAASQAVTLVISGVILDSLSIFNLIAAVLVAGLVFDYALFFSRAEQSAGAQSDTEHAVGICALSTFSAFVILAFSSIPVLQSIGITVAIGIVAGYGLARLGRRKEA